MSLPCEFCAYYTFDEEAQEYICDVMLDEDETARYLSGDTRECRYFRPYDEYKLVQKQN